MDRDNPPNFNGEYPLAGKQIGPAWRVAWAALVDSGGIYVDSHTLVTAMTDTAEMEWKTAQNLLRGARLAGLLEVRYASTKINGKTRKRATYRIAQ